jgi:hypothetical protein
MPNLPTARQRVPARQRVLEMRERDPRVSAAVMARMIGCSRERVRQLLKDLGLPTSVRDLYVPNGAPEAAQDAQDVPEASGDGSPTV